jgi:hypothetical protein
MTTQQGAVEIRVCFKSAVKNSDLIIGTRDVSKARMIARIWGERNEGEPVTRTVFKGGVTPPSTPHEMIGNIKVWAPVF